MEGDARVLDPGDATTASLRERALRELERKYPQYQTLPLDRAATPVIALAAAEIRAWRPSAAQGGEAVPSPPPRP